MKAKYQKYYDALKGANLSGGVSKISSAGCSRIIIYPFLFAKKCVKYN
jgi:hypothetical protein